jgi:hypothetical protein
VKPAEIHQTLVTLGLWEGLIALPPPHAPPAPWSGVALWGVDAGDGRTVDFDPALAGFSRDPLPTDPLSKSPRERYFMRAPDDATMTPVIEPDEEDNTWTPAVRQRADGLLLFYDGDPPPPDDEPVFWTD